MPRFSFVYVFYVAGKIMWAGSWGSNHPPFGRQGLKHANYLRYTKSKDLTSIYYRKLYRMKIAEILTCLLLKVVGRLKDPQCCFVKLQIVNNSLAYITHELVNVLNLYHISLLVYRCACNRKITLRNS